MTMLVLGLGDNEQLSVTSSLTNGGKETVGNQDALLSDDA